MTLSKRKAREMLKRGEYSSAKQRGFLGARASGRPVRKAKRNPRALRANHHLEGAKTLSKEVYGIEYRHLEDGGNYRHDFKRGVTMLLLKDGRIELVRPDGKPLWGNF